MLRRSGRRGDGFQLVERVLDELRQVTVIALIGPLLPRDAERGDAGLGGQSGRGVRVGLAGYAGGPDRRAVTRTATVLDRMRRPNRS